MTSLLSPIVGRRLAACAVCSFMFVAWLASKPPHVRAYCVTDTCSATDDCVEDQDAGCLSGGVPVSRPSPCIYVGFAREAHTRVPGLEQSELEQTILDAFDRWSQVDCGDGPPGFVVRSVGTIDVDEPFACFGLEEGNVGAWMMRKGDGPRGVTATSGAEAGTTHLVFSEQSGTVYDADVTLDPLWLGVQPDELLVDHLRVVAMHEAGHVLGLAHTPDSGALMFSKYPVTADREPTDDDIAGICALYPPAAVECPSLDEAPESGLYDDACDAALDAASEPDMPASSAGGCTAAGVGAGPSEWPWGPAALGVWLLLLTRARSRWRARGRFRGWMAATMLATLSACGGCDDTETDTSTEIESVESATDDDPGKQGLTLQEDPALAKRIESMAKWCSLGSKLPTLSCRPSSSLRRLTRDIGQLEGPPRVAALHTVTSLMGRGEPVTGAICSEVLARVFPHSLGEGIGKEDVSPEMVRALIQAYQGLPPYRARRILPATTHVAVLAGEVDTLLAALDADDDHGGLARVLPRLMVYGRMSVLDRIDGALEDPSLADAALMGMRAMKDWTPKEQDTLCPRALDFYKGPSAALAGRAAQVLRACHGSHYSAVVERIKALHAQGHLERRHLASIYGRCDPDSGVSDGECVDAVSYMMELASGTENDETVRSAALDQLAGLVAHQNRPRQDQRKILRLQKSLVRSASSRIRVSAIKLGMALEGQGQGDLARSAGSGSH